MVDILLFNYLPFDKNVCPVTSGELPACNDCTRPTVMCIILHYYVYEWYLLMDQKCALTDTLMIPVAKS